MTTTTDYRTRRYLDLSQHTLLIPQIKHVIIDLETFSLQPNALIAEFAMVCLNSKFEIIHEFDCLSDQALDTSYGHFDGATWKWHKDNTNLLKRIQDKEYSWNIVRLLESFRSLLNCLSSDTLIYCQGTDFDIPVLRMASINLDINWKFPYYRNVVDLRTFLRVATYMGWKSPEYEKPHAALEDCRIQAMLLASATSHLNYLKGLPHHATVPAEPRIHY